MSGQLFRLFFFFHLAVFVLISDDYDLGMPPYETWPRDENGKILGYQFEPTYTEEEVKQRREEREKYLAEKERKEREEELARVGQLSLEPATAVQVIDYRCDDDG